MSTHVDGPWTFWSTPSLRPGRWITTWPLSTTPRTPSWWSTHAAA